MIIRPYAARFYRPLCHFPSSLPPSKVNRGFSPQAEFSSKRHDRNDNTIRALGAVDAKDLVTCLRPNTPGTIHSPELS